MTGSPVFKVSLNTSKKQKLQRKLKFVRDVPKNQRRLHVDNLQSNGCKAETKTQTQDLSKNAKSISSSLSSFVFANKKGVKRKLDFDVDDASDDMSSFRFSSRNISAYGMQSKNSSLVDFKSITLSPNKNRFRGSYSRSSVTSTCRRRLFADGEPSLKRAKFESPVLGSNSNSKKNEIKLSLKKKFPGVPNSDAARSGLLLNLAFSKYNLSSNDKNEQQSLGFVGDTAATTATKDFVHYSSIKKDENSNCHSPVFMAIKKVKRKLNLEEQDTRSPVNVHSQVKVAEEKGKSKVIDMPEDISAGSRVQKENHCEPVDISDKEKHLSMTALSEHNNSTPNPRPKVEKPNKPTHVESSPVFTIGHHGTQKQRNDLFKNSKLRSSLRNKIFNLSKCSGGVAKDVPASNTHSSSAQDKISDQHQHRRDSDDLKYYFNDSKRKVAPKYDRIVVNRDLAERTKRDSERLEGLASNMRGKSSLSKKPHRWIDDSFGKDKARNCPKMKSSLDVKQRSFMASHMQRFLKDCLEAAEKGIGVDDAWDTSSANGELVSSEPAPVGNTDEPKVNGDSACEHSPLVKQVPNRVECSNCPMDESACEDSAGYVPVINSAESQDNSKLGRSQSALQIVKSPERRRNPESQSGSAAENSQSPKADVVWNRRSHFIIEDPNSQEINNQCVEEVELVIEDPNSEDSFFGDDDDCDTERTLLSRSKRFHIFEDTVDEVILTETSGMKEVLFDNSSEVDFREDYRVEEISTPESVYDEDQYQELHDLGTVPTKTASPGVRDVTFCDSVQKRKRRKLSSDTLMARLTRLLNREKSEAHMWEYELSKKDNSYCKEDGNQKPAVFCVDKMWKEFSRLILLCSFVYQDAPDKLYDLDDVKKFGIDVSHSVVIIMEPEFCPKTLTYSSVFQVHPPWRILYSVKSDPLILVRPFKVEIISETAKPLFYRDPTLPNGPRVVEETQYCTCHDVSCDCILPEGYQTVIQPLLLPNIFESLDWKNYSHLKSYNAEDFQSTGRIVDVVLKHKLYSTECLHLDLRVLHVHKNRVCSDQFTFYHIICIDEDREVCCVVVEGEMRTNLLHVNAEIMFRFFGILPWKLIPIQSVPSFIEHVELSGVSDILQNIGDRGVHIFVLSEKYGNIKRLT